MKDKYYKIINIFLITIIILLLPIPRYKVDLPGRGRLVSDTYTYTDKQEESIYLPFVLARNANVYYFLSSFFRDDIDLYQYKESFFRDDDYETITEISRERVNEAFYDALIWLHNYESIEHEITNEKVVVIDVFEDTNFDLKKDDIVINVDGIDIYTLDDVLNTIEDFDESYEFIITVLRDDDEIDLKGTLVFDEELDRYFIGFMAISHYDIETDIGFEISNSRRMLGSSGGLATGLSLYYSYNNINIPFNIYATGTINRDGKVFEIGGVKHKLIGANKKADLFIFPESNKDDVLEVLEEFTISTEVVFVNSIDEAVNIINNKMK